jgi:hypothetical protein
MVCISCPADARRQGMRNSAPHPAREHYRTRRGPGFVKFCELRTCEFKMACQVIHVAITAYLHDHGVPDQFTDADIRGQTYDGAKRQRNPNPGSLVSRPVPSPTISCRWDVCCLLHTPTISRTCGTLRFLGQRRWELCCCQVFRSLPPLHRGWLLSDPATTRPGMPTGNDIQGPASPLTNVRWFAGSARTRAS